MNWLEYFRLRERLKHRFFKFSVVIILINALLARDIIIYGPGYVCGQLTSSACTGFNMSNESIWGAAIGTQDRVDDIGYTLSNCRLSCNPRGAGSFAFAFSRLLHSIYFPLVDGAIALLLAVGFYFYDYSKLAKKKTAAQAEGDAKEDKK